MAVKYTLNADQVGAQDQATANKGNRNVFGSVVKESGAGDLIYNAGMSQGDFAAILSSFGSAFKPAQASSSGSAPITTPAAGTPASSTAAAGTDAKSKLVKIALVIGAAILGIILFKKFFK